MNAQERTLLRDLAQKVRELAAQPQMDGLRKSWYALNDGKPDRPLIVMKFHGVYSDVYPQPVCEDPLARELEGAFLNLLTEAGWKDDRVIEPEFSVNLSFSFTPFGIPVEKKQALDAHGKPTMGYLSHHIIADLEEDFHLLGKSTWNIEKEYAHKQALFAAANEAFGDILTVKYRTPAPSYAPATALVELMGMENMLLALYDGKLSDETLNAEILPLALILLSNKIRPEAPQTFSYFAQQGVRTKVISGDNPLTVSEVARRAGIPNAEKFVDARTLKTDVDIAKAAEEMTVFGRVTPDQKKKLVAAMKRAGHTVAMAGGGVNDVLALREADCSIAMASGSGVACQASHIVLLDSQFSALPSVVAEGRRVINNIERSASLYLVKNIFTFVLSLITLFFTLPYPYTPAQLSLVNALTIGIPSFILAMEPNENRISGRFMPNVIYRALPAALSDLILVVGVMLFYLAFHIKEDMLSTLCTGIMGIVGLLMIHQTSLPLNKLRKAMLIGLCAAFVVCYFFLPELFTLSALDNPSLLILIVLGLLAFSVMFVCRRGLRKVKARLNKGIFPRRKKR